MDSFGLMLLPVCCPSLAAVVQLTKPVRDGLCSAVGAALVGLVVPSLPRGFHFASQDSPFPLRGAAP
jgi:hypothetical protein